MLRTGVYFKYDEMPQKVEQEYRIAPNDVLIFQLFTNDGFKLIDLTGEAHGGTMPGGLPQQTNIYGTGYFSTYTIEFDGMVKLPMLGRIKLGGLTIREAEQLLEEKYSQYYNRPFAVLRVTNQRVFVFPPKEGSAQVFTLKHQNTTLFELLAEIGGISEGKAHRIKLIRGSLQEHKVYLIDVSTIKNVKTADIVLQANDIIYIEPRTRLSERIIENINPYLALISTITTLVLAIVLFKAG